MPALDLRDDERRAARVEPRVRLPEWAARAALGLRPADRSQAIRPSRAACSPPTAGFSFRPSRGSARPVSSATTPVRAAGERSERFPVRGAWSESPRTAAGSRASSSGRARGRPCSRWTIQGGRSSVRLPGTYELESFSQNGRRLFLVHWHRSGSYDLQQYDRGSARLSPTRLDEPDEKMTGLAMTAVETRDGSWLYTLYCEARRRNLRPRARPPHRPRALHRPSAARRPHVGRRNCAHALPGRASPLSREPARRERDDGRPRRARRLVDRALPGGADGQLPVRGRPERRGLSERAHARVRDRARALAHGHRVRRRPRPDPGARAACSESASPRTVGAVVAIGARHSSFFDAATGQPVR